MLDEVCVTRLSTSDIASPSCPETARLQVLVQQLQGYRMKRFLANLFITLVLAAVSRSQTDYSTYITNLSTRNLAAMVSYGADNMGYKDYHIPAGDYVVEKYLWGGAVKLEITIEIWIEGNPSHGWAIVEMDRSIVAFDNGPAVDLFLVKYGKLVEIDDIHPGKLATIYP